MAIEPPTREVVLLQARSPRRPHGAAIPALPEPDDRRGPTVVAMLRIRNEERFIGKALHSLTGLADAVAILDDGSTDATPDICQSHPLVRSYRYQVEPQTDEVRDRSALLQLALRLHPDWILSLDGDEAIEPGGTSYLRRELRSIDPSISVLAFDVPYLWNSERQYRFDGPYATVTRHPRMFRVDWARAHTLTFASSGHAANFHCGSVPRGLAGSTRVSPVRLLHYGYLDPALRSRKHAFYIEKDPEVAASGFYNCLIDESGAVLLPLTERSQVLEAACPAEAAPSNLGTELMAQISLEARRILEIGCDDSPLGEAVKQRQQCHLVGIRFSPQPVNSADAWFDLILQAGRDRPFRFEGVYDCIVCNEIPGGPDLLADFVPNLLGHLQPSGRLIFNLTDDGAHDAMAKVLADRQ